MTHGTDDQGTQHKEVTDKARLDEPAAEASGEQESKQPETTEGEVAALKKALAEAQGKADDYLNQLLRAKADMENMRRRTEREIANIHKYAIEKFAAELLPVKDSLELGLEALNKGSVDIDKVREGLELKIKMLNAALEKFGIKEVNPLGEKFDPGLHQAMTVAESGEVQPNTVLTVHQKGYLIHDRLIRPAMVVVSVANKKPEGVPPPSEEGPAQPGEPGKKIDEMA